MKKSISQTLTALKKSTYRSKFNLQQKDREEIEKKGLHVIKSHAQDFIETRVAPAYPKNDGRQTPMRGHPIFVAQHATATCCRKCLQKWHGIAKGRRLGEDEKAFILTLVMAWVDRALKENG
jgi:hypothetical protein